MYLIKYGDYEMGEQFVVDGFDLSQLPIRTSMQSLTGKDGGVIWQQYYGFRTITISGNMYADDGDDYYTLWRELSSAFSIKKDSNGKLESKVLQITLSNGDIRYADCKVMSIPDFLETSGNKFLAGFQMVVQAENPFLRDIKKSISIEASEVGGFPVATPVPTPLGGTPINSTTLTVTGDFGSYPEFIINPGIRNPRITNQSTGQSWGLDMTVDTSTGPIPVYFGAGGVKAGDNNEYIQYFTGDFFKLQNGNNTIVFSGADVSGASLDITWWNEYISV